MNEEADDTEIKISVLYQPNKHFNNEFLMIRSNFWQYMY